MKPHLFIGTGILFLLSCANPVTPTGGPKDEQPPVMLGQVPSNRSVNSSPKKVVFLFDENIQLKNSSEEIVISPRPRIKPRISSSRKSLEIIFPDQSLADNTTYSINLNKAVSDLNEGNQGLYAPFIFSTGSQADTNQLSGKFEFIKEPKTKKISIHLIQSGKTSHHIASVQENRFVFSGITSAPAYILAFNDLNGNDSADTNEETGFIQTTFQDTPFVYIYDKTKNSITVFENNGDNIITGIKTQDIRYISESDKSVYFFKDSLFISELRSPEIIQTLNDKYYIKSNKKYSYNFRRKGYFTSPSLSEDSTIQIHYITNFKLLNYRAALSIRQNDSLFSAETITTMLNHITFKNPVTGKMKVFISILDSAGQTILQDSGVISSAERHPVILRNNDSVQLSYIMTDKSNPENKIYGMIKPGSLKTFYCIPGNYILEAWEDSDQDRHITSPEVNLLKSGEPYKKWTNITVNDKMVVEYSVSVHNK